MLAVGGCESARETLDQGIGVLEADVTVLDAQIYGPVRFAGDHDAVVTGKLELGTDGAADIGLENGTGVKRLGDQTGSRTRRCDRAAQGAGHDDQGVAG